MVLLLPPVTPLHCHPPLPCESGKLHSGYKMQPHFPPKFGGVRLIVQKYSNSPWLECGDLLPVYSTYWTWWYAIHKRHCSFSLSLLGQNSIMASGHIKQPVARPLWQRTEASCQQPCGCITLGTASPFKSSDYCSPTWHSWPIKTMR